VASDLYIQTFSMEKTWLERTKLTTINFEIFILMNIK
jgi:hypothetical protein